MTVKVTKTISGNRYSRIEILHPPNTGPVLHTHPMAPEAYHVLDGEYSMKYGNKTYLAHTDDFVFIPKDIHHNYWSGPHGGKVLVISPPGLEGYFKEVADILSR
jgi:quercetin dioxygenase-like cupin family protein